MQFTKYNIPKNELVSSVVNSSSSSNVNNNYYNATSAPTTSRGDTDINSRYVWGQYDYGTDDLEGSLYCQGNIIIGKGLEYNEDNDDSSSTEQDGWEDNDDEANHTDIIPDMFNGNTDGNLWVNNMIKAALIEAKEIYATEHLCVPDPNTGVKTDILDLMVDYNDRINENASNIAANTTEIANLKLTVTANTADILNNKGDIKSLKESNSQNAANITNNTTAINNLKLELDQLKILGGSGGTGNTGLTNVVIDNHVIWNGMTVNENSNAGIIMKGGDESQGKVEFTTEPLEYWWDFIEEGAFRPTYLTYDSTVKGELKWIQDDEYSYVKYISSYLVSGERVSLGYFNKGERIEFPSIQAVVVDTDSPLTNIQPGYYLYCNGELVAGGISSAGHTTNMSGEYSLELTCQANHSFANANGVKGYATVRLTCLYNTEVPMNSGKLTPDGIAYKYGEDKRFILCPDGAFFKFGEYKLCISEEGITVSNGTTTKSLI